MKKSILGLVATGALIAGPAMAADLRMPVKAPPAPAIAAFTWSGCYIGGNVGGKWAGEDGADSVTIPGVAGLATSSIGLNTGTASSLIGGGQVGCNIQTGSIVFGVEGDMDWQKWSRTSTVGTVGVPLNFIPGDSFTVSSTWEASVRGRLGYAWDRTLLYVTGGVAWTDLKVGANWLPAFCGGVACPGVVASNRQTVPGATIGGGLEYAITNNLSLGVEGRYTWYESENFSTGALPIVPAAGGGFITSATSANVKVNTAEVVGKLNWHFNLFGGGY